MKEKIQYKVEVRTVEREVNYIPGRFILAISLAVLETLTILAIVVALCYHVPYFYLMVWATEVACVIKIISSEDNPDYKISWMLLVLIMPIAGFMLYFLFYDRKLHKRYIKRLEHLKYILHFPILAGISCVVIIEGKMFRNQNFHGTVGAAVITADAGNSRAGSDDFCHLIQCISF